MESNKSECGCELRSDYTGHDEAHKSCEFHKSRLAKCNNCKNITTSNFNLPFYFQTDTSYDYFYCGCFGWD